jgi:uroporphyrinogen-III decarboxylase
LKTNHSTLRESEGETPSRLGENRNAVCDVRRGLAPCLKVSCKENTAKVKKFIRHDTNMEPEKLKREFGKHLTFWGGAIDPQHVLSRGTEKEVKNYATHCTEVFKKDGGFIFTQPHNIQADVPPENIIALYQSGNECGRY